MGRYLYLPIINNKGAIQNEFNFNLGKNIKTDVNR